MLTIVGGTACLPIIDPPPGGGESVTETFRLGPFDLAPEGNSGDQDVGFRFGIPRPEGSFGIKAMSFDVVDEDGNPVPNHDVHLHHIVLASSARQDTYCPGGERFAGAGAERNPIELPGPYAYFVGARDRWDATWHVMNTSGQARTVYIEYEIDYEPGANEENSRPVVPFFLPVTGCTTEYDVPGDGGPGSVHTRTRTWQAPFDGWLVMAVGHLHEGGIDISIRDDRTGLSCTMNAEYGHGHGGGHNPPERITTCPVHYPVQRGQNFTVISRYDNSQPYQDVMGIVRAYAWPGSQPEAE
ncbi:MAG TPA: hypothetical protein VIL48_09895 [Acidimicrobiales bacterium]